MAAHALRTVNKKLAVVILLHFEIITICRVSAQTHSNQEFIFKPSDVLEIVKKSCFVAISQSYIESSDFGSAGDGKWKNPDISGTELMAMLDSAFQSENDVLVGTVNFEDFLWPSGKELKLSGSADMHALQLVVFPKLARERTCLSAAGTVRYPNAEVYLGNININLVVQFINNKCNTYRKPNGHLTIDGLHRKEILDTLFHVSDGKGVNMRTLAAQSQTADFSCQKETCNDSSMKAHEKYMYTHRHIPFRNADLNLRKCETIPVPLKEDFFHSYLKISKPVIIKDAIHHWPAFQKWKNEYFRNNYGTEQVHIKLTPAGEFEGVDYASNFENYENFRIPEDVLKQLPYPDLVVVRPATENMNFSKFLDTIESVSNGSLKGYSAYLEYSSIQDIVPELEEDVSEMPFFENMLKLKHLNIWLSDGDTLGKLHFDPFDNFLCQVRFHQIAF